MPHFAQQRNGLQPAKALFDALPFLLTDAIARLPSDAPIDGAAASTSQVLRHMRRRMQVTAFAEDARVINGIRRGEDMHPLIIQPVEIAPDVYAGFELCPPDRTTASFLFTPKQRDYWDKLPREFRFDEVADSLVPRTTLDRILKRAKSGGLVEHVDGLWRKTSPAG